MCIRDRKWLQSLWLASEGAVFRRNGILYQRLLGYQKAVQEYDLNIHLLSKEVSFEGGVLLGKAIAQYNPKQITAIFSTADEMFVGVQKVSKPLVNKFLLIFHELLW